MRLPSRLPLLFFVACGTSPSSVPATPHPIDGPAPVVIGPRTTPYVLTNAYGNDRTGSNPSETMLTTSNVNKDSFGLLFSRAVEGDIYAQPLVVPSLTIGDTTRDVVFVATEHDVVYAFDASDPAASAPLWATRLGQTVPYKELPAACHAIQTELGITSTPVIDLASRTIYVVAYVKDDSLWGRTWRIFALDLLTGAPKPGSETGVVMNAQVPVTSPPDEEDAGADASTDDDSTASGTLTFDPLMHLQRAALLLVNGVIYVAFAGHCDAKPYHGWVMAYDAATLAQRAVFVTTPRGEAGGIWQSGRGLAADADGNVYFISGNGDFDGRIDTLQLGMAFAKLRLEGDSLVATDFFTPHDYFDLSRRDLDLGSSGPLLLPGTTLLVGGGKDGRLFLIDRMNMGRFHDGEDQVVQSWLATQPGWKSHVHGSPVVWSAGDRSYVYVWGETDVLKAYRFDGSRFDPTPASVSPTPLPAGMPGAILTVSSNGADAASAIVWASHPTSEDSTGRYVPGTLAAFAASDVSRELWSTDMVYERDAVGTFARFNPPTVAGGRVYLGTFSGELRTYGLLPRTAGLQ